MSKLTQCCPKLSLFKPPLVFILLSETLVLVMSVEYKYAQIYNGDVRLLVFFIVSSAVVDSYLLQW